VTPPGVGKEVMVLYTGFAPNEKFLRQPLKAQHKTHTLTHVSKKSNR